MTTLILGIDLAGAAHRPTGMCWLQGLRAETFILFNDKEIEAAAGALVGGLFVLGRTEVFGDQKSGAMLMPSV